MKEVISIPLKEEFNEWLCENFTEGSSKSYISYVNSSLKLISKKTPKDNVVKMINEYVSNKEILFVEYLLDNCISYAIKYSDDSVKSKYKNGLLQYKFFLIEKLSDNELIDTSASEIISENQEPKGIRLIDEDLIFDNETLRKNFTFRLLTQDRIYGDVYFPISFIKKLFYQSKGNKEYFNLWVENQIDNIKLYTENSEIINFNKIQSLNISIANEVSFNSDNKSFVLYTENGYSSDLEPLKTDALRNIVIDHVKPMKEILLEYKTNFKSLNKLTEKINSTKLLKGSGKELLKNMKKAGNLLIEKKVISLEDVEDLKKDLEFLTTHIDLKLMCSKENLKKNKKQ
ncbi:MAG: hypothetical protein H6584_02530 [Flavobacteriales bacterium]|nr:hypothetical protein [Flavobacteriales bacterium]